MMEIRLNKRRLWIMLGCISGLTNPAGAVENGNVVNLGEVVVTATRADASLSDVPAAVTVVNAKTIESKNASRLGDVLDQVPSLYLRGGALGQSQGTIGTSGMSLRGIDQTKILILLDGQPIQDANTGKMNWRIPFVEDIERVEVVPGAFSSLYGSNAIGGVVNIITKQPDKREFTAKIKKGWSDASGEDASIYFRDKMDNGLGLVAGLGHQNRDSYVNDFIVLTPCPVATCPGATTTVSGMQATTTREGAPAYLVGDMGTTPWSSTNATAKLFYDLNAHDKVYAGIAHQETDQEFTQFNTYIRDSATSTPVPGGVLNINGQRYNLNFNNFSFLPLYEAATRYFVGYDGTIGNDYLLKIDLGKIERKYNFTVTGPAATWNSGTGTLSDTPNDGLDGNVQLSFPVGSKHFLVTGLALHKESVDQQVYALSDWRNPDSKTGVVNSRLSGRSKTVSVYAQDEISATDKLKVYLGGRWDDWETMGSNNSIVAPIGSNNYPTRSISAFSPKASVVYKPTETAVLRASYGRSFRAPINQELYTSTRSRGKTTNGDPNLQPERGTTWEVGGEFRATESTKATATYYHTDLSNLIMLQTKNNPSLYANAEKARVKGIELGLATKLAKWLEMDVNYAYVDSRILDSADAANVGKQFRDTPKNIAGVGLMAQQGAWSGMLNARYVGHVFWNSDNTDVVEGVPGSYDGYTMVNAKLGYAFSRMVKGSIAVNNLLDKKAYSFFLLPGRNVTAEVDFSF